MIYFVEIPTETYTSLELTLAIYIYGKTVAKKHWSLSKIGFFWTSKNLSPSISFKQFAMFAQ